MSNLLYELILTQSTRARAKFRHGLHGARQGRGQFVAVAQPHVPAEIFGRLNRFVHGRLGQLVIYSQGFADNIREFGWMGGRQTYDFGIRCKII